MTELDSVNCKNLGWHFCLTEKFVSGFLKKYIVHSWYLNYSLYLNYYLNHYAEFTLQFTQLQYKIVSLGNPVSINAALEIVWEVTVHFTLDFERKHKGAEMPVLNYVDLCAWCWSITLLVFSPKCLESTKDSFIHFWVVPKLWHVIVRNLTMSWNTLCPNSSWLYVPDLPII